MGWKTQRAVNVEAHAKFAPNPQLGTKSLFGVGPTGVRGEQVRSKRMGTMLSIGHIPEAHRGRPHSEAHRGRRGTGDTQGGRQSAAVRMMARVLVPLARVIMLKMMAFAFVVMGVMQHVTSVVLVDGVVPTCREHCVKLPQTSPQNIARPEGVARERPGVRSREARSDTGAPGAGCDTRAGRQLGSSTGAPTNIGDNGTSSATHLGAPKSE